jgi:hypothetical protein
MKIVYSTPVRYLYRMDKVCRVTTLLVLFAREGLSVDDSFLQAGNQSIIQLQTHSS